MTSRDVVNVVCRRLPKKTKVGHAGTLDPLAEGVLVIGVGPAARLVPYLQQRSKGYRAVFRLGCSSDTLDLEGEVQTHSDVLRPTEAELREAATQFIGSIEQTPPAYSAIWVDGKRAYERVRAGETVEMPKRVVTVESLTMVRYDYPEFEFETECGSGTYIRTLGFDLARRLGSTAIMSYLRRLSVGPFQGEDSISLQRLRDDEIEPMLVPATAAVKHLRSIAIDDEETTRLGHGLCLNRAFVDSGQPNENQVAAAITSDGQLRAILKWKHDAWCPHKVFPVLGEST